METIRGDKDTKIEGERQGEDKANCLADTRVL